MCILYFQSRRGELHITAFAKAKNTHRWQRGTCHGVSTMTQGHRATLLCVKIAGELEANAERTDGSFRKGSQLGYPQRDSS